MVSLQAVGHGPSVVDAPSGSERSSGDSDGENEAESSYSYVEPAEVFTDEAEDSSGKPRVKSARKKSETKFVRIAYLPDPVRGAQNKRGHRKPVPLFLGRLKRDGNIDFVVSDPVNDPSDVLSRGYMCGRANTTNKWVTGFVHTHMFV